MCSVFHREFEGSGKRCFQKFEILLCFPFFLNFLAALKKMTGDTLTVFTLNTSRNLHESKLNGNSQVAVSQVFRTVLQCEGRLPGRPPLRAYEYSARESKGNEWSSFSQVRDGEDCLSALAPKLPSRVRLALAGGILASIRFRITFPLLLEKITRNAVASEKRTQLSSSGPGGQNSEIRYRAGSSGYEAKASFSEGTLDVGEAQLNRCMDSHWTASLREAPGDNLSPCLCQLLEAPALQAGDPVLHLTPA